jgi:LacI family transcriptional regulator
VSTMKRTRVTLRDVARRLDVHPSTVSRVLNPRTRSMVADAMAERVMEAVEDMGYRPNPFAYSLKTNRSFIIGVLIPDITDPLFPPIIQGVERTMAAAGYTTILADTDNDPERQRVNFDIMRERQVDGLIIATARYEDPVIEEARSGDIPMILVIRTIADPEMPCVINDDAHGIGLIVSHLAALGHRRIAHIAGPQDVSTARVRHRAFEEAMRKAGLEPDPALIQICCSFAEEEGRGAASDLLERGEKFTAMVAANDLLAIGCLDAIKLFGMRCPEDISVTGYNDMPFVDKIQPPLTTVRLPHDEMGAMAARLLLKRIEGDATASGSIEIRPDLVVRESTGPVPTT